MNDSVRRIIKRAIQEERVALLESEAKRICREYKMVTPRSRLTKTISHATQAARRLGFPVALKIASPDILHKTEAGCVIVGLRDTEEVRKGFKRIMENARRYNPSAPVEGLLVEKMGPPGVEVIVGGLRDSQFGPALMFGLGGIFVELFEDVAFRVAPVSERAARHMVNEIKGAQLLKGYRGKEPIHEESLVRILTASSKLMIDHPEISQMDFNPVLAYPDMAVVVDARITLQA